MASGRSGRVNLLSPQAHSCCCGRSPLAPCAVRLAVFSVRLASAAWPVSSSSHPTSHRLHGAKLRRGASCPYAASAAIGARRGTARQFAVAEQPSGRLNRSDGEGGSSASAALGMERNMKACVARDCFRDLVRASHRLLIRKHNSEANCCDLNTNLPLELY